MPCYDIDTTPIERMFVALERLEIDLADAAPETFAAYAHERRDLLRELVELYLAAVSCFFAVMRAVAARSLMMEREIPLRRGADRTYLEGFLPIYERAAEAARRRLHDLLMAAFADAPEFQAEFVARMVASQTVQEAHQYVTSVQTADNPAQAQEHGQGGKEIVDSVKDFVKSFIKDVRFLGWRVKKESIDQGLHVLNEVLGMVFRGPRA
jgi:hypothetical protein